MRSIIVDLVSRTLFLALRECVCVCVAFYALVLFVGFLVVSPLVRCNFVVFLYNFVLFSFGSVRCVCVMYV